MPISSNRKQKKITINFGKKPIQVIISSLFCISILLNLFLIIFFVLSFFSMTFNSGYSRPKYLYTPPNPEVHMPLQLSNNIRSDASVPPKGWKEYIEPNGYFSIWYPNDWQVNESTTSYQNGKEMYVTIIPLNVDDVSLRPSLEVNITIALYQDSCRKEFAHKTIFLGLPASYEIEPDDGFEGSWDLYTDKKYYIVEYFVPWVIGNTPLQQELAPPHFSLATMLTDRKILETIISSFKPTNYKYIIPCNQP